MVQTGLDVLIDDSQISFKGKSIGVITNHTGCNSQGSHLVDIFTNRSEYNLKAIFTPEHGIQGDVEAGEFVSAGMEKKTGLPVYSLYGNFIRPTPEMLREIDVLVYDIQDVGSRFYTYISTMGDTLSAAAESGVNFVILDRPNPITGRLVEGPVPEPGLRSFVSYYPIPIRYGLTIGELAQFFNSEFRIGARLEIVKMKNWEREMWFNDTGLSWVKPSPQMHSLETATIYPGTCLFEGINVSVGRGTPKAFQWLGAPWVSGKKMAVSAISLGLEGVTFEAASLIPGESCPRYPGIYCPGILVLVTDRERFKPVDTAVHLMALFHRMYPQNFVIEKPGAGDPRYWLDKLYGSTDLRLGLEKEEPAENILERTCSSRREFLQMSRKYLLY